MAQKLREKIASQNFGIVGTKTASIGVTTFRENDTITELLSRVDDALYLAKLKGKNRVEMEV